MTLAVTVVIGLLIVYTATGAVLALDKWEVATWVSSHDLWHRSVHVFRKGGFVMAATGPPMVGLVIALVLRSPQ